jgi:glucosamine-6-phosphate deaminase
VSFTYNLAKFISFQDAAECERVRAIPRAEITKHPNPEFKIHVIDDLGEFYSAFATDIVTEIKTALEAGRQWVGIFPVGPMPQYAIAARMINALRLPMHHVHTFNMDEYADQDGCTAPGDWEGSFQRAMMDSFFGKIDPALRPPMSQVHFPSDKNIADYGKMLADMGGADVCYGGIGWCGHIAFWESDLGNEFGDDLDAYCKAGPRIVELTPMTIMQNALHSFGGDWSWVPPKAATIGPAEIVGARRRSFFLDGYIGGGVSWQRFIARLCAHGRVNTLVPGSILQGVPGDYTFWGPVADDVHIHMS